MNTAQAQALERLVREYRERKAQIRADEALSWEKRELAIKALGDEYHRARNEMEAA
jgi:hypothetical protein